VRSVLYNWVSLNLLLNWMTWGLFWIVIAFGFVAIAAIAAGYLFRQADWLRNGQRWLVRVFIGTLAISGLWVVIRFVARLSIWAADNGFRVL
jgi:hypothetical protein